MTRDVSALEFEELYLATARDVFAFVRRRTTGDAEDLVAETYAIAWRRCSDMPPPLLRRAWLFGVARRLLLSEHRHRLRENDLVHDLASTGVPLEAEPGDAKASIVNAALGRLSETDREMLRLSSWENLTPAELAVVLRIRPGAARVRLHRARRALAGDPEVRALVGRPDLLNDAEPGHVPSGEELLRRQR